MESDRREEGAPLESDGRRRIGNRRIADEAIARAGLLCAADQALIRAVFEEGKSSGQIAQLTGVSARSVRRRVTRLVDRLSSGRFRFVSRRLDEWTLTRRRVAIAVILRGQSSRAAASQLGISVYLVRYHLHAINSMFESSACAA